MLGRKRADSALKLIEGMSRVQSSTLHSMRTFSKLLLLTCPFDSPLCSTAPLANEARRINLIMQTAVNNIVVVLLLQ